MKRIKALVAKLRLGKIAGFLAASWVALKIFLRLPTLAVGIATIPIDQWLSEQFRFSPIVGRLIGLGIFMGLMVISWSMGELIVALAGWAILMESMMLVKYIRARIEQRREAVLCTSSC